MEPGGGETHCREIGRVGEVEVDEVGAVAGSYVAPVKTKHPSA